MSAFADNEECLVPIVQGLLGSSAKADVWRRSSRTDVRAPSGEFIRLFSFTEGEFIRPHC